MYSSHATLINRSIDQTKLPGPEDRRMPAAIAAAFGAITVS